MACCAAAPAAAHAFGARYDLPLPLRYYLIGAGAAVALSFVVMARVFRAEDARSKVRWTDLTGIAPLRAVLDPVTAAARVASVGLLALVVAAGLFGTPRTTGNFAPTFVWIIWWVGLAYVASLAGNPWPTLNPWSIVFSAFERLARRPGTKRRKLPGLACPSWLGAWPAVGLFMLFAWFELISETAKEPATLAIAVLIYSGITWAGMAAFGHRTWLARGEAFSLAFEVFGRFAPIGSQRGRFPDPCPGRVQLRPYAGALIVTEPCRLSVTAFIVAMLSTVTFDGFKETPLWGELLRWIARSPAIHPVIRAVHDAGLDFHVVIETVMLVAFPLVFLAVFLGVSWMAGRAAGDRRPVGETVGLFVFSLVPIAIAYHLAHYLSYLLIAGQFIIPLVSDPFGFGWNLFGTADYRIDIGVIGARSVWLAAVIAIVLGHVIAVGVAHFIALRTHPTVSAARRSQYPFLVLMVGYTMISLWILSQPIVGGPSLGVLTAPKGIVALEPFEFRERCVELGPQEAIVYSFRADRPLAFDIHYHDGLTTRFLIKRNAAEIPPTRFVAEHPRRYCLMWINESLTTTSFGYRVVEP